MISDWRQADMETNLNDLEGLRIAMDIEARGYHFYQGAYDRFKVTVK